MGEVVDLARHRLMRDVIKAAELVGLEGGVPSVVFFDGYRYHRQPDGTWVCVGPVEDEDDTAV